MLAKEPEQRDAADVGGCGRTGSDRRHTCRRSRPASQATEYTVELPSGCSRTDDSAISVRTLLRSGRVVDRITSAAPDDGARRRAVARAGVDHQELSCRSNRSRSSAPRPTAQTRSRRSATLRPRAVISAMHLPDINGVELAQQIRSEIKVECARLRAHHQRSRRRRIGVARASCNRVLLLPKPFTSRAVDRGAQLR